MHQGCANIGVAYYSNTLEQLSIGQFSSMDAVSTCQCRFFLRVLVLHSRPTVLVSLFFSQWSFFWCPRLSWHQRHSIQKYSLVCGGMVCTSLIPCSSTFFERANWMRMCAELTPDNPFNVITLKKAEFSYVARVMLAATCLASGNSGRTRSAYNQGCCCFLGTRRHNMSTCFSVDLFSVGIRAPACLAPALAQDRW